LHISANTRNVGIYTSTPGATLDVNGTVVVRDTFTVQGASSIIGGLTIANTSIAITSIGSNLMLDANGGDVSVSGAKIRNLASPSVGTDAVNKTAMETYTKSRALALTGDVTGLTTSQIASDIISVLYPPAEYATEVTICRMRCINTGVATNREFKIVDNEWQYIGVIS
jgi:hypothetical protein